MPTCGMSRHGLLAAAQTQQTRGKSENGRERKMEGEIERERGMEHTWPPQVQCCISNPVVKE